MRGSWRAVNHPATSVPAAAAIRRTLSHNTRGALGSRQTNTDSRAERNPDDERGGHQRKRVGRGTDDQRDEACPADFEHERGESGESGGERREPRAGLCVRSFRARAFRRLRTRRTRRRPAIRAKKPGRTGGSANIQGDGAPRGCANSVSGNQPESGRDRSRRGADGVDRIQTSRAGKGCAL